MVCSLFFIRGERSKRSCNSLITYATNICFIPKYSHYPGLPYWILPTTYNGLKWVITKQTMLTYVVSLPQTIMSFTINVIWLSKIHLLLLWLSKLETGSLEWRHTLQYYTDWLSKMETAPPPHPLVIWIGDLFSQVQYGRQTYLFYYLKTKKWS